MSHQQLWLLRHGEAVPHDSKPDFDRELTARGQRQSIAAGEALARLGLEFDACVTSPLVRALGTAELACESLNVTPDVREEVGKGFDLDVVRALLAEQGDGAKLLIVGHNPSFEQVVLDLCGGGVDFKKGGLAALRVTGGVRGELLVLLRPRELETIALSGAAD